MSLVDIVIEKMYPVGYDETLPDGTRVGTVNAAGNSAADAKVEAERMAIMEKEKRKLDKKIDVLLDVMSKAYGMAGGWAPGVDGTWYQPRLAFALHTYTYPHQMRNLFMSTTYSTTSWTLNPEQLKSIAP